MNEEQQIELRNKLLAQVATKLIQMMDKEEKGIMLREAACIDLSPEGRELQIQIVVTDNSREFLNDFQTELTIFN